LCGLFLFWKTFLKTLPKTLDGIHKLMYNRTIKRNTKGVRKMKNYQMIRGQVANERCTNKSIWGSPLYCDCGCQTPRDTDPDINLTGVTVSRKLENGYADFILSRNGEEVGRINTQYNYIVLDGNEFLGVDEEFIADLLNEARSVAEPTTDSPAGDTLQDTAARVAAVVAIDLAEQDARNANQPGYCTICHSYCWGDCAAS
jgi:hypothetical protein